MYFDYGDESSAEDHASMHSTREAVENAAHRMNNLPKWEYD